MTDTAADMSLAISQTESTAERFRHLSKLKTLELRLPPEPEPKDPEARYTDGNPWAARKPDFTNEDWLALLKEGLHAN